MVVLGALMLGAAFQLLLDGMSKMSTTPSELAGSLLGGAATDPANARQAALFEGLAKTLNGLDPRAWRIYGLAKIALAGLLLYTVAALWTNDRRGQKAAVAAAWAGIAYQVGSAAFLIGYVRPGVLAVAPAWVDALVAAEPEGPPAEPLPPTPEDCEEYTGNRQTGCTLLAEFDFGLEHMPALDNLWTRESGWNHQASNPSSGAYGIPQALPGSKMASVAADWETNPATQIRWGLGYIRDRYGNPTGAWEFFQANGWY